MGGWVGGWVGGAYLFGLGLAVGALDRDLGALEEAALHTHHLRLEGEAEFLRQGTSAWVGRWVGGWVG